MILLFDVGNTSIGIGVSENNNILETYRINSSTSKSFDEYYISIKELIDTSKITGIAICSVVPRITELLVKISKKFFMIEPVVVSQGVKTGINITTDNPKEVGSDLICDAAALEDANKPTVIVDLGTATKYIYIKNKTILGVIISPGLAISTRALVGSTALLPDIDILVPKKVLGTNTVSCMQSGVTYGRASEIDGLIERIKKEVNEKELSVYLTGGLATIIKPILETSVIYDSRLVLKGLLNIYNKNTN